MAQIMNRPSFSGYMDHRSVDLLSSWWYLSDGIANVYTPRYFFTAFHFLRFNCIICAESTVDFALPIPRVFGELMIVFIFGWMSLQ